MEEMNVQNSIIGMNGNTDIEQNGLKIKPEEDINDDVEMETPPPPEERNGHTNGYQNGTSHQDPVEDMGKVFISVILFCSLV